MGRSLAVHGHVLALVAFGQVSDRRSDGRFRQGRRLAWVNAGGFLAGLLGAKLAVTAHGYSFGAVEDAGLA